MREQQRWLCASVLSFQKLCELNESWHVFFSVDPVNGLIYTFLLVCFFFSLVFPSLLLTISLTPSPFLSVCLSFQVFGFQAGLTCQDSTGGVLPLIPIIPSFSTALYGKLIQMPTCWWVCSTSNMDGNLSEHRGKLSFSCELIRFTLSVTAIELKGKWRKKTITRGGKTIVCSPIFSLVKFEQIPNTPMYMQRVQNVYFQFSQK